METGKRKNKFTKFESCGECRKFKHRHDFSRDQLYNREISRCRECTHDFPEDDGNKDGLQTVTEVTGFLCLLSCCHKPKRKRRVENN